MTFAITLHVLSAIVWVGGMFFAYMVLRPEAADQLEPPARLTLWNGCFSRFFVWVWAAVVLLPVTGYWVIFNVYDGMATVGKHVHVMNGLGFLMIALYLFVFFVPYRKLREAVATQNWQEGGRNLGRIRHVIGVNLVLGLITAAVASGGRYL